MLTRVPNAVPRSAADETPLQKLKARLKRIQDPRSSQPSSESWLLGTRLAPSTPAQHTPCIISKSKIIGSDLLNSDRSRWVVAWGMVNDLPIFKDLWTGAKYRTRDFRAFPKLPSGKRSEPHRPPPPSLGRAAYAQSRGTSIRFIDKAKTDCFSMSGPLNSECHSQQGNKAVRKPFSETRYRAVVAKRCA